MANILISQDVLEAKTQVGRRAIASQVVVEVAGQTAGASRVHLSQQSLEAAATKTARARLSQVVMEVAIRTNGPLLSQMAMEAASARPSNVRISQVILEVGSYQPSTATLLSSQNTLEIQGGRTGQRLVASQFVIDAAAGRVTQRIVASQQVMEVSCTPRPPTKHITQIALEIACSVYSQRCGFKAGVTDLECLDYRSQSPLTPPAGAAQYYSPSPAMITFLEAPDQDD